jgi:hypothetical protein
MHINSSGYNTLLRRMAGQNSSVCKITIISSIVRKNVKCYPFAKKRAWGKPFQDNADIVSFPGLPLREVHLPNLEVERL